MADFLRRTAAKTTNPFEEFIAASAKSAPKTGVLFEDDFSSNRSNWGERRDHQKVILRVRNGHYEIENKVQGQTWCTWQAVAIDQARDFEVEAVIQPWGFAAVPGRQSQAKFGVLWGGKDVNNFHVAMFEAEGYFSAKTNVDNEWKDLIPWRRCAAIAQQAGSAPEIKVGIRKRANVVEFTVDGEWLEDAEFAAFFGSNVGFFVANEVDIWVRRLKVSQF